MKWTICQNCKARFKHDPNQQRKFCSQSCSTIIRNRLQAKPKMKRPKTKEKREWEIHWKMYSLGLVTIENIKGLMKERYTNLRS